MTQPVILQEAQGDEASWACPSQCSQHKSSTPYMPDHLVLFNSPSAMLLHIKTKVFPIEAVTLSLGMAEPWPDSNVATHPRL